MSQSDYEVILNYCKEMLPYEACGLLGGILDGDKRIIKKVYLLSNVEKSSEHFSMDPKEQLMAVKDMRANGYIMLGNFHSHPNAMAEPSNEDKRLAYDTKVNYLILSLMDMDKPVFNAFMIDENKFVTKEELVIQ